MDPLVKGGNVGPCHGILLLGRKRLKTPNLTFKNEGITELFASIIDRLKNGAKYKTALQLLKETKFTNEDIGPINEIAAVNKFVISIPKCGTTAIQRGFERIGHRVIHAHNNPTTYEAFSNGDRLRCAQIALETLVKLRRHLNTQPIHLFFGYREPVGWYLSLAGHFGVPLTEKLRAGIVSDLHYAYPWNKYRFAESQRIVESASDLKLLSGSFDTRAGYTTLHNRNIKVVLYRFDRMRELERYIKQNIDERFEMKNERVNMDYDYRNFVNKFRLPANTLKTLYGDSVFSYFYDRSESEQLVSKYLERSK
jgi:hypothetical protein